MAQFVVHEQKGIGKIVKYYNNRFGSEDYYVVLDANGNCVQTIPQRNMQGSLHNILLKYVKNLPTSK